MSDEELEKRFKQIKTEIRANAYSGTWIFIMMLLFLNGCFKGCGY